MNTNHLDLDQLEVLSRSAEQLPGSSSGDMAARWRAMSCPAEWNGGEK